MVVLVDIMPTLLYILGGILLVILIIIGFKVIRLMNNIDEVVQDVDRKVKSLNNIFHIIDTTTDMLASLTDKAIDNINNFILKMFRKKYNKEKEEEENE
jgi:hypothetical protein